jgi:hypothetical protein
MCDKPMFKNVITEETLCQLLGLKKDQLNRLRQYEGLPFIRINQNKRVYLEQDIMEWLMGRRASLGGGKTRPEIGSE